MTTVTNWLSPGFVVFVVLAVAPSLCQTKAGSELKFDINAIDRTADPCVDFYQYACGGWMARNPIPPDRSYSAVFQQMRDLSQARVTAILQSAAGGGTERSKEAQKIGDYYASCVDEKIIEADGLDPLRPELERIKLLKNTDDLAREVARLQILGTDPLFSIGPDQKLGDSSQVIAYLDQSSLNMPEPGYYTSKDADMTKARAGYRAHLEQVFVLLGDSTQQAADSAEDVLRIETALARSSLTPLERRDRKTWYHEMTAAQLQQLAPAFLWPQYFAAVHFEPIGQMNVAVPNYMQTINELVTKTPIPEWKSYLRWELVRLATPALPARFRQAEFDFYGKTLQGVEQQSTRTRQCEELVNRDLGEAVGKIYVQQYFPPQTRIRVLEMVQRLREAMQEDFKEISWMTAPTREEALKKLDMVRVLVGYPDHWRDYSSLEIQRNDALGNAFRGQEFDFRRLMAKIGQPVDKGAFYELPQGVTGYHDNPLNVVVFTAGILQPPFFDPHMDDAINFGLAGAVIGHELSHAFDDKGHLFDGAGNMRDWWKPEDAKLYDQRAACFVRQYSRYKAVDDLTVDGQLTLGENIADNGGLQLAHRAFQTEHPKEGTTIDGFTPEQRFFLGWAQWRCMNVTDKTARVWARTDEHSPGKWRVNGVVSNMDGFAQAYHCKANSPMVNREPCRIW